ncbi:hypothetical protein F5H01DRAFT_368647 [Linnemannia elongata]|nr:hypothetical protein F5H01DRAFT_368647 [Linnemannia elongata]
MSQEAYPRIQLLQAARAVCKNNLTLTTSTSDSLDPPRFAFIHGVILDIVVDNPLVEDSSSAQTIISETTQEPPRQENIVAIGRSPAGGEVEAARQNYTHIDRSNTAARRLQLFPAITALTTHQTISSQSTLVDCKDLNSI